MSYCREVVGDTCVQSNALRRIEKMLSEYEDIVHDVTRCGAFADTYRKNGMHGNASVMVRESSIKTT